MAGGEEVYDGVANAEKPGIMQESSRWIQKYIHYIQINFK